MENFTTIVGIDVLLLTPFYTLKVCKSIYLVLLILGLQKKSIIYNILNELFKLLKILDLYFSNNLSIFYTFLVIPRLPTLQLDFGLK